MPRSPRKTTKRSLKTRLKHRLSSSLRAAKQRALPTKSAASATAKSPARTGPAASRTTPRSHAAERVPRLPPSKRAPRTHTLTTARPTVGAPPLAALAPNAVPPLTDTSPPRTSTASVQPFVAGPAAALPLRYGITTLVLLVRDPWWLYAYWEVTPARAAEVTRMMSAEERARHETVLRLYDITDARGDIAAARRTLDVVLTHDVDNWFVDTGEANRTWVAELGYRTAAGRFYALVRSNVVTTPRAGPSDQFDEAWMTTDDAYWKLVGVVYGLGFGTSSFDIRQLLERRFREVISSARGSAHMPASGGAGAPLLTR